MAEVNISELPVKEQSEPNDEVAIVDNRDGMTKRTSLAHLHDATIPESSITDRDLAEGVFPKIRNIGELNGDLDVGNHKIINAGVSLTPTGVPNLTQVQSEITHAIANLPPVEAGSRGEQGEQGVQGDRGAMGLQGVRGLPGEQGDDGEDGADGTDGTNGVDGTDGTDGAQGIQGDIGLRGVQGSIGLRGEKGEKGDRGETGFRGAIGFQGSHGDDGADGEQGIQGVKGDKGDKGDQGDTGEQGIQGIQGEDGDGTTDASLLISGTLHDDRLADSIHGLGINGAKLEIDVHTIRSKPGDDQGTLTIIDPNIRDATAESLRFLINQNSAERTVLTSGLITVASRNIRNEFGENLGKNYPSMTVKNGTEILARFGKFRPDLDGTSITNGDLAVDDQAAYHNFDLYGEVGIMAGALHLHSATDKLGSLRGLGIKNPLTFKNGKAEVLDYAGIDFTRKDNKGEISMYVNDGSKKQEVLSVKDGIVGIIHKIERRTLQVGQRNLEYDMEADDILVLEITGAYQLESTDHIIINNAISGKICTMVFHNNTVRKQVMSLSGMQFRTSPNTFNGTGENLLIEENFEIASRTVRTLRLLITETPKGKGVIVLGDHNG